MIQIHITGIDTTNAVLLNALMAGGLQVFPKTVQCSVEIIDATTLDLYLEQGA